MASQRDNARYDRSMLEEGQTGSGLLTEKRLRVRPSASRTFEADRSCLYFYPGRHAGLYGAGVRDSRRVGRVRAGRRGRARRQPGRRGVAREVQEEVRPAVHAARRHGSRLAEAYGVWVEKEYKGKTYMGVERSTFVIDAEGTSRRCSAG